MGLECLERWIRARLMDPNYAKPVVVALHINMVTKVNVFLGLGVLCAPWCHSSCEDYAATLVGLKI